MFHRIKQRFFNHQDSFSSDGLPNTKISEIVTVSDIVSPSWNRRRNPLVVYEDGKAMY